MLNSCTVFEKLFFIYYFSEFLFNHISLLDLVELNAWRNLGN